MLVREVQAASPAVNAIHGCLPILSTIILVFCTAESESKSKSKSKKRIDERVIPLLRWINCRVLFKLYIAEIFMTYCTESALLLYVGLPASFPRDFVYSLACSFTWATLLFTEDCSPPLQPSVWGVTALGFVAESVLMYFVKSQGTAMKMERFLVACQWCRLVAMAAVLTGAVVVKWMVCEHVMEGSDVEKAPLLGSDGGCVVEKGVDELRMLN